MKSQGTSILRIIRKGESETLEFKESFGKEAIENISAFANTDGGALIIGVDDRGSVKGIQLGRNSIKDWADQISQTTAGLHPSIQTFKLKEKTVVRVQVPESRIKPVMVHGKAFKRSGNTTRQMSMEEITRVALASVGLTWDEIPEVRAQISDISLTKVKAFMDLAKQKGRRPVPEATSAIDVVEKLGLIQKGKPTRAAILLFGKDPQKFYSQALVKIGRFRSETLIVDDRRVGGTLFEQIDGAMSYFREKLETRFEMTGRPARNVIWEYPLEALREAVTNAVCHRDYLSTRDTEVRIYDQELMVWNVGGLPGDLSIADLKKKHASVPRNRKIAEILFYAGFIEQWGSGTGKILGECAAAEIPEPVFEEVHGFRVTFKKSDKHPTSTRQVPDKHPTTAPHIPVKVKLLAFCNNPKTLKEMMDFMGLKDRETFMENYLHPALKEKLLARTDPKNLNNPKQQYFTTNKGKKLVTRGGTK